MHTVYITPFDRSTPPTPWLNNTVDGVVASWVPVWDAQRAGQRAADKRNLEVRTVSQPQDGWRRGAVDAVVATWLPAFLELQTYRARDPQRINVRSITQPNDQWFYRVNVFDPALWPAVDRVLRGYRAVDRARLAVENVTEPQFSWVFQAVDAFVAQLASVWAIPSKYRKPANPALDPNVPQPGFAWVNSVTDAAIAVYLQSLYPRGYQAPARQSLPSTSPLQSWIYNSVTPAYNTSFWPAIQSIQSYRAVDRQATPSTAPVQSWIYNSVTPAYNNSFWPAIQSLQANPGRSLQLPGLGPIVPTVPIVPPTPPVGTDVYLYWMHRKINKRM